MKTHHIGIGLTAIGFISAFFIYDRAITTTEQERARMVGGMLISGIVAGIGMGMMAFSGSKLSKEF